MTSELISLFIPSPSRGVWHVGPFPIRAYALCIIAGVIAALWLGERRWIARGGKPGQIGDIAIWAIPFGLVGARVYSLFTDSDRYFGAGKAWWEPLAIWQGGIGIWGAIAAGMLGAWIVCRRRGIRLRAVADALAPALLLAQAMGRWGNYFNQELFGRPTTKPWGLKIDLAHRPPGYEQYATFHPTFLYECIWDLGAMGVLLWLDRRFRLGWGRCFALYVMLYCAGRFWIENLRIDTIEHHILGLRLNAWTAVLLFVGAAIYFLVVGHRHPVRETSPYVDGAEPDAGPDATPEATPEATDETSEADVTTAPGRGADGDPGSDT